MGRVLAVDLGTRRVGLAITDPLQIVASPLETIPYRSGRELVESLSAMARDRAVETVVIGLPGGPEGREGEGCRRARNLARELENREIHTVLWDESFSSRRAEEVLREMGSSRRRDPARVDRLAAAIILREYLDEAPSRRDPH